MKITLIQNNAMHSVILPDKISGQYFINHTNAVGVEERLLSIVPNGTEWRVECGVKSYIIAKDNSDSIRKFDIRSGIRNIWICIRRTGENALLIFEDNSAERTVFKKYSIHSSVSIGSNNFNTVCLKSNLISDKIADINYDGKTMLYQECTANARTYINGIRTTQKTLLPGDNIYILGYSIIVGKDILAFNNTPELTIKSGALSEYAYPDRQLEDIRQYFDDVRTNPLFTIAPRFYEDMIPCNIEVAMPPNSNISDKKPAVLQMGPSFTMGTASAATAALTVANGIEQGRDISTMLPTVVMACSMMASAIIWPIISKSYEKAYDKKHEKDRKKYYLKYLNDIREEVHTAINNQREYLLAEYPSIDEIYEIADRRTTRLWERLIDSGDFLSVCAGYGSVPMLGEVSFEKNKNAMNSDVLMEVAEQLKAQKNELHDAPITFSLKTHRVIGIIGERTKEVEFTSGLIVQLAALHCYDALKLVVIYDIEEQSQWEYIRWLPHTWDNTHSVRYVANELDELKLVCASLEALLAEEADRNCTFDCHYVVIFASRKLFDKTNLMHDILASPICNAFSFITLFDEINQLPKECTLTVELRDKSVMRTSGSSKEWTLSPMLADKAQLRKIAVALSGVTLNSAANKFQLPNMISFLQLYEAKYVEELNIVKRWKENNPVSSLAAPIGIDSKGGICSLDLHQKAHGPHGLIAGTTGSGKSEFIMTYILSLALNYSPHEVSFVLIDYKGGGMAAAFSKLPHVAGIITNLDGASVNRSLISIESELKRRQRIFLETGKLLGTTINDIYTYQRLCRENDFIKPMQHMFIISDEFAELKKQQPEFMDKLISAARIGRSLGVHLILATQKPSGVVNDQIWSNSRFKICLKVQDREDSTEVIKRPDAASITQTGRFYLQVGYNEVFDLGQSAWCGADYAPDDVEKHNDNDKICIIDNVGRIIAETTKKTAQIASANNSAKIKPETQLEAIVKHINQVAMLDEVKAMPLWLDTIPFDILQKATQEKYGYIYSGNAPVVVMGECDIPENQAQEIMTVSAGNGNIFLCGSEGSGKTSFLFTYIYGVLENYSPAKNVFYILDFSSEMLKAFEDYDGVGAVITLSQKEKLDSFINYIAKEISLRREKLAAVSGGFLEYNRDNDDMPAIIVVISNYGAFKESYDDYESSIEMFTRDGQKLGIFFIVTGLTSSDMKFRMMQNFRQNFALNLNDNSYISVIGSTHGKLPANGRGRGLMVGKDDIVCEFQTAFLTNGDVYRYVTDSAAAVNEKWKGKRAFKIKTLPQCYTAYMAEEHACADTPLMVPIALDTRFAEPVYADFYSRVSLLLHGGTNVQPVLSAIAAYLSDKARVVILDPDGGFVADGDNGDCYHGKQVVEQIHELYRLALERYHQAKEEKCVPDEYAYHGERVVIIFNSLASCERLIQQEISARFSEEQSGMMYHTINERIKELENVLNGAPCDYGIHSLIIEKASAMRKYITAPWFVRNCKLNKYLWFGSGLANEDIFKHTKLRDSGIDYGENLGYCVDKGKIQLIEFMTSEEE